MVGVFFSAFLLLHFLWPNIRCIPSVEVSLSETPHRDRSRPDGCRPAWPTPPSVCECVRECEALL